MTNNIPLFKVFMSNDSGREVDDVLKSGFIGQGQKVEEFEGLLRSYLETPYVNTVNSGTSALHLAIHLIKEAETKTRNVILSVPITCTATNSSITANKLNIKWIDTDKNTCNIDLVDLENKIDKTTLAVMIVHWAGYPVDMDSLNEILDKSEIKFGYRPYVIEDCAHAFGSTYQNKKLGINNFAAYSFQAIKHLTTGDGGVLICPNEYFHKKAKLLRWYGLDRTSKSDFRCDQLIEEAGYKFHMNDIAATIGITNFKEINNVVSRHVENGKYLQENLKEVGLLESKKDRQSSHWVFTILVDRRDDFINYMNAKGITTSRVHDRNDKHPCFKNFKADLPNTTYVCDRMICIPCGWWLEQNDMEYIADTINRGW
jgi:dTDP-4-amino-4,6-dideoxygalactose transaminase